MKLIQIFLAIELSEIPALPEETSFNSRRIHNDTVLLIIPCVAENSYYGVDASRQLSETKVFHRSCCDQWFVWIIQNMCQCIHSHMEIGNINTHGLFPHSTLKIKTLYSDTAVGTVLAVFDANKMVVDF